MSGLGWAVAGLAFAWMLLAAKAHGRQLRLERELRGLEFTDFRHVPPEVEALWVAERRRFWPQVAAYGLAFALLAWRVDGANLVAGSPPWLRALSALAVAFLVAMSLAFAVTGLMSLARLRRDAAHGGQPQVGPAGPGGQVQVGEPGPSGQAQADEAGTGAEAEVGEAQGGEAPDRGESWLREGLRGSAVLWGATFALGLLVLVLLFV